MAVEIHKALCGGKNKDNLIESSCFIKYGPSLYIYSDFSQVSMFCNSNHSKLVLECTYYGVSEV